MDYVLVWDAFEEEAVTEKAYQRRKIFEVNLIKEGLDLEYEPQEKNGLNFIKVSHLHLVVYFEKENMFFFLDSCTEGSFKTL